MMKEEKKSLTPFEKWFKKLHIFAKWIFPLVFPYKKHGHTEPYDDRAYIFVGNHLSVLDVVMLAIATNKPVHFMAKKELFEKEGLMKKFATKSQCIPVNRDGSDVKAVMQAMKYLKGGESIAIFPEGTRNKTDEIFLPFKSGATAISIKTKTPIVPVIQVKKIKCWRRSHAIYGEPIEFTEYYDKKITEDDIKACDDILREKMLELYYTLKGELESKKKKKKD
jgi:1-acyl-sn-glycerol-3-phosphate acyltransferase